MLCFLRIAYLALSLHGHGRCRADPLSAEDRIPCRLDMSIGYADDHTFGVCYDGQNYRGLSLAG